ncbi:MAG: mannose-1-phosphate guanylyltransferase [Spirochaetia bacterium]|nr:mannose-1-phosphate guanylyltransferase [Spirochaetia bacterium]
MAGGKGERFWPRSREKTPKQLQQVYSNKTLLEETLTRALTITDLPLIYIGCNAALKKTIQKKHPFLKDKNFVVEPEGRNTAPIIALAALILEKEHPGHVQVVLSADHFITPLAGFKKTVSAAVKAANQGWLVTLGVKPTRPEVGYGYIHAADELMPGVQKIHRFVEKPAMAQAQEYVKASDFFWNAGIFIWKASTILAEFEAHARDVLDPVKKALKGTKVSAPAFAKAPKTPIDIAIMEKSNKVAMIGASFLWDDVGSWLSLERIVTPDAAGNVFVPARGADGASIKGSSGNIVVSPHKMVALLGVKDLVVVEDGDVLFITDRSGISQIKELIADMRQNRSLQKYLF